jgi:hypothetical protein
VRIGNYIDAAMIFAGANFVSVHHLNAGYAPELIWVPNREVSQLIGEFETHGTALVATSQGIFAVLKEIKARRQ